MQSIEFTLHKPHELTAEELGAWERLRQSDAAYQSPYFHPQFTLCVGAVRDDVEIALLHRGGELCGVFPFQRGPGKREGRPVGGRMSDFHVAILSAGTTVSLETLMAGCQLRSFAFDHLILPNQPFAAAATTTALSPYLDLSRGFDEYRVARNRAGTDEIKQTERKLRKCEREVGPLRFEFHTGDRAVFETLLRWKSQQYRDTGVADVFSFPWTVALLERILQHRDPGFRGVLSALHVGEKLVAMHYAIQSGRVLHLWFPAYDRALLKYSPGLGLLYRLAEESPHHGIERIDFGKGTEQYKLNFASACESVAEGSIEQSAVARTVKRFWAGARSLVKSSPGLRAAAKIPLRLMRPIRERNSFR